MLKIEFNSCLFSNNRGNFADIFYLINQPFNSMIIKDSVLSSDYQGNSFADFVQSDPATRESKYQSQLTGNSFIKLMRTKDLMITKCRVFGNQRALKGAFLDI